MTVQYTTDALGYYLILGVPYDASDAQIKQNYRDRAKIWHPDHNSSAEATENFQKLSVAYDILKDEKLRLYYDLFSQAYTKKDFPDMFNLKTYTDQAGQENAFVRVFSLENVVGKIVKSETRKKDEICNSQEALSIIWLTSLKNWLLGWWGWPAALKNIQAIKNNYQKINQNRQENFTLLVHNAVAYAQENKKDKALYSALQAQDYANNYQNNLLKKFIYFLGENPRVKMPVWKFSRLKYIQLVVPAILLFLAVIPVTTKIVTETDLLNYFARNKEIIYHQEVRFSGGGQTFDDVVVSKILNIPVDTEDLSKLYHLKQKAKIMYGPADDFDVLAELHGQTTVRITGKTPDDIWYRVMIDNGNMGFVRQQLLNKGIGRGIPLDSKIYTGPRTE